jgi:hypothetical protein
MRELRVNLARSAKLSVFQFNTQFLMRKLLRLRFEQVEQTLLRALGGLYTNG